MPKSKQRAEHKQHAQHHRQVTHQDEVDHIRGTGTARTFTIPVFLLFGAGMAWFSTGLQFLWILAGAVLGAAVGYFVGNQMDKAFSKK